MYYAKMYTYGVEFYNEFAIYAFDTKRERDEWVKEHEFDRDGFLDAEKMCASEVYKITGRKMKYWRKIKIENHYHLVRM